MMLLLATLNAGVTVTIRVTEFERCKFQTDSDVTVPRNATRDHRQAGSAQAHCTGRLHDTSTRLGHGGWPGGPAGQEESNSTDRDLKCR